MAQVRMMQTAMHVPWKVGEIVTVQVGQDEGDGMYLCETLETYPPDLKERHSAELVAREVAHQAVVDDLRRQLAVTAAVENVTAKES